MKLRRLCAGFYETLDGNFEIQNPHSMYPVDRDRSWYAIQHSDRSSVFGPFKTLKEVREFLGNKTKGK